MLTEFDALCAGNRAALARAITRLENERPGAEALWQAARARCGGAQVIGITGAPGAGKSTLIAALLERLLARGQRVAVLAVDPSSPVSGGALLGDRVRMGDIAHEAAFIRSVSARGHLGGLSRTAGKIIDLFDAAGFSVVIVETVGTGQSEVEIARYADLRLVIFPPGLGDEVQAIKAGVLEIADLLVVTKADVPGAEHTALALRSLFSGRRQGDWPLRVLSVNAPGGEGLEALIQALDEHRRVIGQARRLHGDCAAAQRFATSSTLVLVGATRLARTLAPIALAAGFAVRLIDPRPLPGGLPEIAGVAVFRDERKGFFDCEETDSETLVLLCSRSPALLALTLRAAQGRRWACLGVPAGHLASVGAALGFDATRPGPALSPWPRLGSGSSPGERAIVFLAALIAARR